MNLQCLLGHDYEEQDVSETTVFKNGIEFSNLRRVEYECSRCGKTYVSVGTPVQLQRARDRGTTM